MASIDVEDDEQLPADFLDFLDQMPPYDGPPPLVHTVSDTDRFLAAVEETKQPGAWTGCTELPVAVWPDTAIDIVQRLFDASVKYNHTEGVRIRAVRPTEAPKCALPCVLYSRGDTNDGWESVLHDVVLHCHTNGSLPRLYQYEAADQRAIATQTFCGRVREDVNAYFELDDGSPTVISVRVTMRLVADAISRIRACALEFSARKRLAADKIGPVAFPVPIESKTDEEVTMAIAQTTIGHVQVDETWGDFNVYSQTELVGPSVYPLEFVDEDGCRLTGSGLEHEAGHAIDLLNAAAHLRQDRPDVRRQFGCYAGGKPVRAVVFRARGRDDLFKFLNTGIKRVQNKVPIIVRYSLPFGLFQLETFHELYRMSQARKHMAIIEPGSGDIYWSTSGDWPRTLLVPYVSHAEGNDVPEVRDLAHVVNFIAASTIRDAELDVTIRRQMGIGDPARTVLRFLGIGAPPRGRPKPAEQPGSWQDWRDE
jgi:hypothetical protein